MLKDNFFSILNCENTADSEVNFIVRLHCEHTIYQAHFPNNPITPGVCIIQIVKELFAFLKQTDFTIKKIKNVKFLHPIDPTVHNTINFDINWEENNELFRLKTTVYEGDTIFSKINMEVLRKINS